ncbi:MAG: hypothetical protein WAT91_13335 [Saprospiraceae bacterium]
MFNADSGKTVEIHFSIDNEGVIKGLTIADETGVVHQYLKVE